MAEYRAISAAVVLGFLALTSRAQTLTVRANVSVKLDSSPWADDPQSAAITSGSASVVSQAAIYSADQTTSIYANYQVTAGLNNANSGYVRRFDENEWAIGASHLGEYDNGLGPAGYGTPETLTTYDFSLTGAGSVTFVESFSVLTGPYDNQLAPFTLVDGNYFPVFYDGGSDTVALGQGNHEIAFGDYSNYIGYGNFIAATSSAETFNISGQVGAPTPEPASLACLGLGFFVTLRRRQTKSSD